MLTDVPRLAHMVAALALLPLCPACGDGSTGGHPPEAVLEAPSYCPLGEVMQLDGTASSDEDDDIVLFRFTIADGAGAHTLTAANVEHTCSVSGLIQVMLEVIDSGGRVGRAQATVSVRP